MSTILRASLLLATFCASVSCAARSPYGNFVPSAPLDAKLLANDAVEAVASSFPPARTRLRLAGPAQDAFGAALAEGLRQRGFAVHDSMGDGTDAGKQLHYVLDSVDEDELYHVTLFVDEEALTRPYRLRQGATTPAGNWVRKEQSNGSNP